MTDTIKYKATERYSTGWTDPRSVYGADMMLGRLRDSMWKVENTDFELWTNENLRNAWLIRFGSGAIRMADIADCGDRDYLDIAILLDRRGQLEAMNHLESFSTLYKLTQK